MALRSRFHLFLFLLGRLGRRGQRPGGRGDGNGLGFGGSAVGTWFRHWKRLWRSYVVLRQEFPQGTSIFDLGIRSSVQDILFQPLIDPLFELFGCLIMEFSIDAAVVVEAADGFVLGLLFSFGKYVLNDMLNDGLSPDGALTGQVEGSILGLGCAIAFFLFQLQEISESS